MCCLPNYIILYVNPLCTVSACHMPQYENCRTETYGQELKFGDLRNLKFQL